MSAVLLLHGLEDHMRTTVHSPPVLILVLAFGLFMASPAIAASSPCGAQQTDEQTLANDADMAQLAGGSATAGNVATFDGYPKANLMPARDNIAPPSSNEENWTLMKMRSNQAAPGLTWRTSNPPVQQPDMFLGQQSAVALLGSQVGGVAVNSAASNFVWTVESNNPFGSAMTSGGSLVESGLGSAAQQRTVAKTAL